MADYVYVSLFAGAGGDTTGALVAMEELGFGRPKHGLRAIAVNHDVRALATHWENNQDVEHFDCDVEKLDPDEVLQGERITVLWISAPCQPYSPANGKNYRFPLPYTRPQQRATPAYAVDWIVKGNPMIIIEENVTQIMKKWDGWPQHVKDYESLGYEVSIVPRANAADFGVPQDRRRMILVAVKKGIRLNLPKPSHSNPKKPIPGTQPWKGAIEVIDRSLACPSIFGRTLKDGSPDDLSPDTRARMARYIDEQGIFWHLVAEAVRTSVGPVRLIDALNAVPESQWPPCILRSGDELHIDPVEPFITKFYNNGVAKSLKEPLGSILTGGDKAGHHAGVVSLDFVVGQNGGAKPRILDLPQPTLQTAGFTRYGQVRFAVPDGAIVETRNEFFDPVILPHNGEDKKNGQKPRRHKTEKPMPAVCASRARGIAFVFLYTYNGKANAKSLQSPSTTITCVERHGVVETRIIVKTRVEDCYIDVGMRMLTVEEQAAGQGFPPNYVFLGKKRDKQKQIGNAVPPPMAKAFVRAALEPLVEVMA